ncbi:MAG TPA: MoaD/ThiS family protein [Novosphingobium sp.]|nr:MoaD/ThiS family protein [Novosphingobium sp.]
MPRVVIAPSFCTEYFGATSEFEVEAGNLFQLVDALESRAPGFAQAAGIKVAFAIDGQVQNDWTAPLPEACEVLLVPRIGGGGR